MKHSSEKERKKKLQGDSAQSQNVENFSLLLSQGKALYQEAIERFPKYTGLKIDFANFL